MEFRTIRAAVLGALGCAVAVGSPALAQNSAGHRRLPPATTERPPDRGPFTPEANRAYNGGGVILEGVPGGPAPEPRPMPPQGVPLPPR